MTKILAFEKIITQISILKNDFLGLDKLVIYGETLDKIIQNENQPKTEPNLELNLALKLFLSSHDFLVLELSHFWLQNQYTLGTNSPSREKKIQTKWQNLLENLGKLTLELHKLKTKQSENKEKDKIEIELADKITSKISNQKEKEQTLGSGLDLKTLLIEKILQISQKVEKILKENSANTIQNSKQNSTPKLTFLYKKNLIDISIAKKNWNLQTHFDELIAKNSQENNNLVIQTNLEKTGFDELQKICSLQIPPNVKLICASPSSQIAKIGQNLFVKNNQQSLEKLEIENGFNNFVSNFNLEIFLDQKLQQINFEKSQFETAKNDQEKENSVQCLEQKLKLENFENLEIKTTNSIKNSSQKLTQNQNLNQKIYKNSSKKIIVIVCGQNSTLKDCSQIVVSHPKFAKKFLILGESGSLTKIASKIETFEGFLIVKMSDLLHLLEISNLQDEACEIWLINQPFLRVNSFWSSINCEKIKELNLQAQINFLDKTCNCSVYFVKTYWK